MHFKIEPGLLSFNQMDWSKTMKFTFQNTDKVEILNFSYKDGNLIVTLSYAEDLSGNCLAEVNFDKTFVLSDPKFLDFKVQSINYRLMHQS